MIAAFLTLLGCNGVDARTLVVKTTTIVAPSMISMPGYIDTLYTRSALPICQFVWTYQLLAHWQTPCNKLSVFLKITPRISPPPPPRNNYCHVARNKIIFLCQEKYFWFLASCTDLIPRPYMNTPLLGYMWSSNQLSFLKIRPQDCYDF